MFRLISDSGCDLSMEERQKYDVNVVPFYITFDQETHLKEGVDISTEEYFNRLLAEKNLFPKTSQPSPSDYIDAYTPHLEAGEDIVCLTISSKVSGTYNSATLAAEMLGSDYPECKIVVLDSLNGSIGQGLILKELIKMRDAGYSLEEAVRIAEEVIKTTKTYFTLDSLEYLKKGGRIGPTTALVGGILGLRPVLHLVDGEISQLDSVRGSKKVMKLMTEALTETLKDELQSISLCIGHILRKEDSEAFKDSLEESLGMEMPDQAAEIGAAIGTHAGPGALVVSYCKKYSSFVG